MRREGRDVVLTPGGVAGAFPGATGRLVVFLHGLCETEDYWRRHRDRLGATYGETLAARGWTPVYLRANTGLPLRENGVVLASLVQRLVDAWPTEVTRIALVGHSLGGLIIRASSAVTAEHDAPAAWTRLVTDVVTLGTPHLGSWFAVGADHASRTLARVPEVAAFGKIIDRRAPGIHDLIEGLAHDVPPLPHARYRLVSATLTRSPRHPVASAIGDLLVTPRSAVGRDRRGTESVPRRGGAAPAPHRPLRPAQPPRRSRRAGALARRGLTGCLVSCCARRVRPGRCWRPGRRSSRAAWPSSRPGPSPRRCTSAAPARCSPPTAR
ncbi:hypothetical protein G5V59_23845 [Nocardioides sp. W3-2-3]|uniref:esterase/lipase family protein n=1 Tax=Nocardioides convexus TaxID=2712224 RepID=UPI00241822E8|nr:hypothetical protein [Nocardioides convexus]NHA01723.1 hypothetical protein [Nocardioides convexus]